MFCNLHKLCKFEAVFIFYSLDSASIPYRKGQGLTPYLLGLPASPALPHQAGFDCCILLLQEAAFLTLFSYHFATSLRFESIIASYLHLISSRIFFRSGPWLVLTSTLTSLGCFLRALNPCKERLLYYKAGTFGEKKWRHISVVVDITSSWFFLRSHISSCKASSSSSRYFLQLVSWSKMGYNPLRSTSTFWQSPFSVASLIDKKEKGLKTGKLVAALNSFGKHSFQSFATEANSETFTHTHTLMWSSQLWMTQSERKRRWENDTFPRISSHKTICLHFW